MVTIRDLLKGKGYSVWSVPPDTSVLETLRVMADKDVGALPVIQNGELVGIISERDFVREIAETGQCILNISIESYMTKEVFTVTPDQTTSECMQLMTAKRVRHLPVLDQGKVIGMVSIGDIVKETIHDEESTIHSLEAYIEGRDYGH